MNKPNEKLEKLALDILGSQEDLPKDKFGSIIMIIMIIAIIVNGIRVIQECDKHNDSELDKVDVYKEKIQYLSNRRGWFTKMKLRKLIRKELSPEDYKEYGWSIVNAILNKGASITDEEVSTLLEITNV